MVIILGGGLSGSLLAYRLSQKNPELDFLLIEAQNQLGGEHTWSFHESDLSADSMNWIRSLITSSWDQQEVKFNNFNRVLSQRYHSVTSSYLNQIIQPQIRDRLILNESVLKIDAHSIYLKDKKIEAQVIFDARGIKLNQPQLLHCGFQKFVGMDLEFEDAHELKNPIIMDVNCEQKEGYRFFYLLPWNSHSVLIEDTRYSSAPDLNDEEFKNEIRNYCNRSGWKITKELRTEIGSLPIPLSSFKAKSKTKNSETIDIGTRGGYFHWTTGYSFSYAVRTAEAISSEFKKSPNAGSNEFTQTLKVIQDEIQKQSQYFALLNRMLFLAAQPSERWKIFHRFYQLNEDLIFRFYQGNLRFKDQVRILIGRPPVPLYSALKSAFNTNHYSDIYGKDVSDTTQ